MRRFYAVYFILVTFAVVGCGSVTKSLVAEQEWSENYATLEGVQTTSPLMIDGNKRTIGETETPVDSPGSTQYTEAVIKLPEEKSIRRIVIYTPNIDTFNLYAATEDGEVWKPLQEIKNNQEKKLDLTVSAVTDQIKIRVRKTSDDERIPGDGGSRRRIRYAKGKIQEIEIYGLVEKEVEQVAEAVTQETEEEVGTPAVFVAPEASEPEAAQVEQAAEPSTAVASSATSQETPPVTETAAAEQPPQKTVPAVSPSAPVKEKEPPATVNLKSSRNAYPLAGPIPVSIDIKIGSEDLVVLEDQVKNEMLLTKLVVKTASGGIVACSKEPPRLSIAKPYRSSGRQVEVRGARTLEADSVVTIDIKNLLECYPISEPGTYTVQFDTLLTVYSSFVGRYQSEIEDLERSIREISTSPTFAQTEKVSVVGDLKAQIEQLKQEKSNRYIIVGTSGKSLKLTSNVLELTIQ